MQYCYGKGCVMNCSHGCLQICLGGGCTLNCQTEGCNHCNGNLEPDFNCVNGTWVSAGDVIVSNLITWRNVSAITIQGNLIAKNTTLQISVVNLVVNGNLVLVNTQIVVTSNVSIHVTNCTNINESSIYFPYGVTDSMTFTLQSPCTIGSFESVSSSNSCQQLELVQTKDIYSTVLLGTSSSGCHPEGTDTLVATIVVPVVIFLVIVIVGVGVFVFYIKQQRIIAVLRGEGEELGSSS